MNERFTSRKLWLFLGLATAATVALFTHVADFAQWADFQQFLFLTYAGANVGQKVIEKKTTQ